MKIIKYRFHWNMSLHSGSLDLTLEDDSNVVFKTEEVGTLIIWVDLLRKDAPVFYWKNENGQGLASGWEEVVNFRALDGLDRHLHDGQA